MKIKNMQRTVKERLTLKHLCIMKIAVRACTDENVRVAIVRSATDQINWEILGPLVISALYLQNPKYDKVPINILEYIMNTCEGLIHEVLDFLMEILHQQPLGHSISEAKVYQYLTCIRLKEQGTIDESGSLLSVLKSGFVLSDKTVPFLAKYWVDVDELKETLTTWRTERELTKAGLSSKEDVLRLNWPTWYADNGIKDYDASKFWPDELSLSLLRHAFLIKASSRALEYFYNAIEESERREELERILKILMYEKDINWNQLEFILEKFDSDRLDELAMSHEYSSLLYKVLFLSWRHRRFATEMFLRLAPCTSPAHTAIVLYGLLENLLHFKRRYFLGHYSDMRSTFIKIWKDSPVNMKICLVNSGVWMRNFLFNVCKLEDENILTSIVDTDYGSQIKLVEICLFIVLVMISLNKTHYIDYCVLTISENTLETYDSTNLLSYDSLSDFILREVEIGDVSLLMLMPEYLMDVGILKWNIVTDRPLMLRIFIKHFENVNARKLTMFLKWLLNVHDSLYMHMQITIARRNWLQNIYTNLMANLNFDAAVTLFEFLRISPAKRLLAKNCLRQNMVLLYVTVSFLLKNQVTGKVDWSQTDKLLDVLFDTYLDKQQFIQEFLLSEEGVELLMGVVTASACYEQYVFLKYEAFKMYRIFRSIKIFWIEPYLHPNLIFAKLQIYGHPNSKIDPPLLVERCCIPNARHRSDVRKIIDANYRIFLAVLKTDLEDSRILELMNARSSVTEVSQEVAHMVGVHVEVIF